MNQLLLFQIIVTVILMFAIWAFFVSLKYQFYDRKKIRNFYQVLVSRFQYIEIKDNKPAIISPNSQIEQMYRVISSKSSMDSSKLSYYRQMLLDTLQDRNLSLTVGTTLLREEENVSFYVSDILISGHNLAHESYPTGSVTRSHCINMMAVFDSGCPCKINIRRKGSKITEGILQAFSSQPIVPDPLPGFEKKFFVSATDQECGINFLSTNIQNLCLKQWDKFPFSRKDRRSNLPGAGREITIFERGVNLYAPATWKVDRFVEMNDFINEIIEEIKNIRQIGKMHSSE
ncbi:MAG: hypothetical protein ACLFQV_07030 [Vulcanimicrobiota bacterium]